jgi:hypothetical protein
LLRGLGGLRDEFAYGLRMILAPKAEPHKKEN